MEEGDGARGSMRRKESPGEQRIYPQIPLETSRDFLVS
jgi:hypothetical protein